MAPPRGGKSKDKPLEESNETRPRFTNDLRLLHEGIDPDNFIDEYGTVISESLVKLDEYITGLIDNRRQMGQAVRNEITKSFIEPTVELVSQLCCELRLTRLKLYETTEDLRGNDSIVLLKTKIRDLERKNAVLEQKNLDMLDVSETLKELVPEIILNKEKELLENNLKQNDKITAEIKQIRNEITKTPGPNLSYAKVLAMPAPPVRQKDPEGVLLIQPISEEHNDFTTNRELITKALHKGNSALRIRNIARLHSGGVKIISANPEESLAIKATLETDDGLMERFRISIPNKRKPQFILYNVESEIEASELSVALIEKNITLATGNNEPRFNVDFSIPGRNPETKHWVISIDPKLYPDICQRERLYLNWRSVKIAEFVGVRQCRQCHSFSHTKKFCPYLAERKIRCFKCGDLGDDKEPHHCGGYQCTNCISHNKKYKTNYGTRHSGLSKDCHCFKDQKKILQLRTDYGF